MDRGTQLPSASATGSASAIEDDWGVDAGNVKTVAWVGIVAVVILTFLWAMLRDEPLTEDVPQGWTRSVSPRRPPPAGTRCPGR
ncbi:MAG: hypothetical protein ABWX74_18005 [Aeromicrobium sp.]